jgi:hypothetical protein
LGDRLASQPWNETGQAQQNRTKLTSLYVLYVFDPGRWMGIGRSTGRSMWWGLVILPYPVGWLMALAGGVAGEQSERRQARQGSWTLEESASVVNQARDQPCCRHCGRSFPPPGECRALGVGAGCTHPVVEERAVFMLLPISQRAIKAFAMPSLY